MSLKDKLQEDLKESLKKKEEGIVSVLRQVTSVIHNKEIEKKTKLRKEGKTDEEITRLGSLADEEIIQVLASEAKKRREAVLEFGKGKREDLVQKEQDELEILQKYLPEQLSEEEIKKIAKEVIERIGATELKDMGKVMAGLMSQTKGKADGTVVSKIVKELLVP